MTETPLLAAALAAAPSDPDSRACWALVVRAIEVGWVDADDLGAIASDLEVGNDRGYQELMVQPFGDEVEVTFLDEAYRCSSVDLLAALRRTRP